MAVATDRKAEIAAALRKALAAVKEIECWGLWISVASHHVKATTAPFFEIFGPDEVSVASRDRFDYPLEASATIDGLTVGCLLTYQDAVKYLGKERVVELLMGDER